MMRSKDAGHDTIRRLHIRTGLPTDRSRQRHGRTVQAISVYHRGTRADCHLNTRDEKMDREPSDTLIPNLSLVSVLEILGIRKGGLGLLARRVGTHHSCPCILKAALNFWNSTSKRDDPGYSGICRRAAKGVADATFGIT